MSKTSQPQTVWTARASRPKQFDTRILDRMEVAIAQYRHFERNEDELPEEYVASQRIAYKVTILETARELVTELAGDEQEDEPNEEHEPDGMYAEYLHRAEIGRRMLDIPGYGHD